MCLGLGLGSGNVAYLGAVSLLIIRPLYKPNAVSRSLAIIEEIQVVAGCWNEAGAIHQSWCKSSIC